MDDLFRTLYKTMVYEASTVAELIELLKQYPPDMEVFGEGGGHIVVQEETDKGLFLC